MTRGERLPAIAVVLLVVTTAALAAQVRDVPGPTRAGSASVAGIVADDRGQPVRRAAVRLASAEELYRIAVTDGDGRFAFSGLPAGRFTLSAAKASYITAQYGARRPGRPGTSLVITEGARLSDVRLTLARGAVITGRIVDARGQPVAGMFVRALLSRFSAGGRSFLPVTTLGTVTTDDRGVYRFFSLEPGEYIVGGALARFEGGSARLITQAEIHRALRDAQRSSFAAPPADRGAPRPVTEGKLVVRAPVYYPGTTSQDSAATISLRLGEERTGIDFTLSDVETVTVSGVVVRADGQPPAGARVALMPMSGAIGFSGLATAMAKLDGSFELGAVVPGEYAATAMVGAGMVALTNGGVTRAVSFESGNSAQSPAAPVVNDRWQALTTVSVGSGGLDGLTLTMGPGATLTGRVVFAGGTPVPQDPTRIVTIYLQPRADVTQVGRMASVRAGLGGEISIPNILPGRYLVNVNVTRDGSPVPIGWAASSIVINGREVIDGGVDVAGTDTALDVVVTLTDRIGTLSGTFQNASGQPAADYTMVLFSTDRSMWRWQSRRIKTSRPSSDGKYSFADLPPGDYYLTAVTDIEPNEWFDSQYLDAIVPAALKLTIAEGEKKVQDIRTR